jgi:hypothetical protein
VAEHVEQRLLQPKRLEEVLSAVLNRWKERSERRTTHIAELRKRAAEAEAKLKRLYDAIENGIADLSDLMLLSFYTEVARPKRFELLTPSWTCTVTNVRSWGKRRSRGRPLMLGSTQKDESG